MKNKPKIVFEDQQILVLDKPAGLVVNRDRSVKEETVQDWIRGNFQFPISNFQSGRDGIVHRLDKETSGLLVVAKTRQAFENLQSQFKRRLVKKKYLALVHAQPFPSRGEVTLPIVRSRLNRKKFEINLSGRKSKTKYQTIAQFKKNKEPFSLVELFPITGRTHQIRVHLKHLGCPVVADAKYGGRKMARADRVWCRHQFLHASYLGFSHPKTGKKVEFFSPLPEELIKVLAKFRNSGAVKQ